MEFVFIRFKVFLYFSWTKFLGRLPYSNLQIEIGLMNYGIMALFEAVFHIFCYAHLH
jgi:hypothetical protein